MMMVKSEVFALCMMLALAGSAMGGRVDNRKLAEIVGGPSSTAIRDVSEVSMMKGSVMKGGQLASGISQRSRSSIQVFHASKDSVLVSELSGREGYGSFRGQAAFQMKLEFASVDAALTPASMDLMPALKEEIEEEMAALNAEHNNCAGRKAADGSTIARDSCRFVLCTYVGTSGSEDQQISGDHTTPFAGKMVTELTEARGASIQGEVSDLKDAHSTTLDIPTESVVYYNKMRFAAVILKAFGSLQPPCEQADMDPDAVKEVVAASIKAPSVKSVRSHRSEVVDERVDPRVSHHSSVRHSSVRSSVRSSQKGKLPSTNWEDELLDYDPRDGSVTGVKRGPGNGNGGFPEVF